MSEQNRTVYNQCHLVVDELLEKKRLLEAEAILRALGAYLEVLPAHADGSCRRTTEKKLEHTVALLRVKRGPLHGL